MDGSNLSNTNLCVGAILVTDDRRYLMQLRDDFAGIRFPGAWGLFGGHLDPGESPEEAIARELLEELEFAAANPAFIFRLCYPEDDGEQGEKHYYQIPVTTRQIAGFVQHEGAGMHLFAYDELMRQEKVIPHDLAAVVFHRHRGAAR